MLGNAKEQTGPQTGQICRLQRTQLIQYKTVVDDPRFACEAISEAMANPMSKAPTHIRIVALGDSLTVGFQSYELSGGGSTPYTDFLADHIKREFPLTPFTVEIVNKGIVGELTEQMLARFDSDVIRLSPGIVIILGGSNDLGWEVAPEEVFLNLSKMYGLSLENKITPIACTVPSILGFDGGIPPRMLLNKLVQDHCMELGIPCADVFRATLDEATNRLAFQYSSDGLHLNSEGYRKIGSAIYEEGLHHILHEIVEHEATSGAT
jgi:acyl-CoA thioesterase-1